MTGHRPVPPRLARLLFLVALRPTDRECALSDLGEEFDRRCVSEDPRAARRCWQQAVTSVGPGLKGRLRTPSGVLRPFENGRSRNMLLELRWAWRGVRGRRWRAAFVVALLGVALAANAIVLAAADAFVFRAVPYLDPGRLAIIETVGRSALDYLQPQKFRAWREQRDLVADIQAHAREASAYVTAAGITDVVRAERVTPGLFPLLGVMPAWGRPFTDFDATSRDPLPAIVGEAFARRLFGNPASALGRTFFTGKETLTIVGVMAASFRFPTALEEIWRPLDLSTWPENSGLRDIVRLAPGQTMTTAARAVADRSDAVERAGDRRVAGESMRLRSMAAVRGNQGGATVFAMLVGAALCLLLIACANVASLEMAAAAGRVRVHAIQAALGASRWSLVRVGFLEGVLLIGASAVIAIALAVQGTQMLLGSLTPAMRDALTSPLAINGRVMAAMVAVAGATWIVTSLPSLWRVSRLSVVDGLRDDARTMPVTGAEARSRQTLMAGQVALTTLLLVGALFYLRTYVAQSGLGKGFDASNIATIEVSPAPDAGLNRADLEVNILARLRGMSGVRSVARVDSPPPSTQSGFDGRLSIDGQPFTPGRAMLHIVEADPEYFSTMAIDIVNGRAFDSTTPADEVVVDGRFARAYWADGRALGARFQIQGGIDGVSNFHIVGISRDVRSDRVVNEAGDEVYVVYMRPSARYHPLTFVVRLDDAQRLGDLGPAVRAIAPRSVVRTDTVEARYARLFGDTRLAAGITSVFGMMALVVATSGVYAVMAFLVAGRSKEIAIRMALGADRRNVRRLIFDSSIRFIAVGMLLGLGAAVLGSRWIAARLVDVTPTDPATYVAVSGLVIGAAVAAMWWPARRAAHVDPAVTLRAQ